MVLRACPICDRLAVTSAACAVAAVDANVAGGSPLAGSACPAVGAENADARRGGCGAAVAAAAAAVVPPTVVWNDVAHSLTDEVGRV